LAFRVRRVRQFYAWHKWTGLISAFFVFIICFSGAIAVFKEEIDRLVTPAKVVRTGGSRAPLSVVIANVRRQLPRARLGAITFPERADAAYVIAAQDGRQRLEIFADPYTGAVTGTRTGETLANVIRQTHLRFFYFGYWGRVVVGLFGVVLVISTVTGLFIYGRFMRGVFSRGLHFWNIRAGFQLATSDWHKFVGIAALAFNLVIAFTGAFLGLENLLSYTPGAIDYLQHRPKPPARTSGETRARSRIGVDDQLRIAREALPGFEPQIVNLADRGARALIYGKMGGMLARERTSYVIVDTATGAVIEKFRQTEAQTGSALYFLVEPLHYGAFAGVIGKIVYLLFGMTGAFLSITGFLLWWRKRRNHKGRKVACEEPSLQSSVT